MILTRDNIVSLLKEIFGYRWVDEAARALGCNERTVRRWAAGENKPTTRQFGRINRLLSEKIERLRAYQE